MKKTKTKKTTALARRAAPAVRRQTTAIARRPAVALQEAHTVGEGIALGALGLVELKLTKEEEQILSEPVPIAAIEMKPVKVPTPYLSHPGYTRWFNRAFGRTGWALVPAAKPMKSGNSVVCPYVLHIHGKPVAFAMGEQEYHENNKEQTYGDALESTVASALRRCAKRLGIGLELWDRRWLRAFVQQHAVCVTVKKRDNTTEKVWRMKTDGPLWNEEGGRRSSASSRPEATDVDVVDGQVVRRDPAPAQHKASGEPITKPQRQRFYVIVKNSGRDEAKVTAWLRRAYGYTSAKPSKEITRDVYNAICSAVEGPGELPQGRA